MATIENSFNGVEIGKYDNSNDLSAALKKYVGNNVFFFCVGTDRATGDSIAPFVGTFLKEKGYTNVMGTLEDPVHAQNIEEKIKEIPEGFTILAIDASIGRINNIGKFLLKSGSLKAGAGVGKDLPMVGDYHIQAVVSTGSGNNSFNFMMLANTRMSLIYDMANKLTAAIESAYPLSYKLMNKEEAAL